MNLANRITIGRILLVPFFVIAVVYCRPEEPRIKWLAIALFALASISDAVDGYLARTRNQKTALGSFLDPFADKLLLLAAFVSLTFSASFSVKISNWILIVIISREVILISGLLILFISLREVKIQPSILGKITTVAQMITVAMMLFESKWAHISAVFSAMLTILSGLGYVLKEIRRDNHGTASV